MKKMKKDIHIVFNSKLYWEDIWGKLKHIWAVIFNKSLTFNSYIKAKDLEKLEKK